MTYVNFRQMKYAAKRKRVCTVCGLPKIQQKTFICTVNPFNKNEDGSVKNPTEVRDQAKAQAIQWQSEKPDPKHVCNQCKEKK
jgi:hypothetical protein